MLSFDRRSAAGALCQSCQIDREDVIDRFRRAMETHDLDGLLSTLSPDVTFHSPITSRVVFRGRAELRELMEVHFAVVRDVRYRDDELVYTATVRRQSVEIVNRLKTDDAGLVCDITAYVRPLPGLTALAAALGPPLAAARRSRAHARLLRVFLTPLANVTAFGDRLAKWFI